MGIWKTSNTKVKNLLKNNAASKEKIYTKLVVSKIRLKYTQDEENAIIRKKLANNDNGEFDTYNAYVEECKAQVKLEVNGE